MTFGDIVRYNGRNLVFLAATSEIIYFAIVFDADASKQFIVTRERTYKSTPRAEKAAGVPLYCFVVLSTDEFKNCIAHYGFRNQDQSAYDLSDFMDVIGELNESDKKALRDEIVSDGIVPGGLREAVENLD